MYSALDGFIISTGLEIMTSRRRGEIRAPFRCQSVSGLIESSVRAGHQTCPHPSILVKPNRSTRRSMMSGSRDTAPGMLCFPGRLCCPLLCNRNRLKRTLRGWRCNNQWRIGDNPRREEDPDAFWRGRLPPGRKKSSCRTHRRPRGTCSDG